MIRRLGVLCVAAWLLLAALAGTCLACSCAVATPEEQAARADVVFTGTVTGAERFTADSGVRMVQYVFAVDAVEKGDVPSEARVNSAEDSATCGVGFREDARYRVMARGEGGAYETTLCDGNTELGTADPSPTSPAPSPDRSPTVPTATSTPTSTAAATPTPASTPGSTPASTPVAAPDEPAAATVPLPIAAVAVAALLLAAAGVVASLRARRPRS